MLISDSSFLDEIADRSLCPICSGSRKYFCYTCRIPLEPCSSRLPNVKLPFRVRIIKHKQELDGKSTAVQAAILAPDDVKIIDYDEECKDFVDCDLQNAVLVYPDDTWTSWHGRSRHPLSNQLGTPSTFSDRDGLTVIFIDGTWQQAAKVARDSRFKDVPRVSLSNEHVTQYWRPQHKKPDTCLATIEAVYYFVRDYHVNVLGQKYEGQYDNLLFFFDYFLKKVHRNDLGFREPVEYVNEKPNSVNGCK